MPRKVLLVLAAALVAVALPTGASGVYLLLDYQSATDALQAVDPTIDPPPNDPSKDFAVGGYQGIEGNNVGFSAHSGPLGQNAQGKLSETVPGYFGMPPSTFQARFVVTCLVTAGNDAALGLVPTDSASNDQPNEFVLAVHDGGLPRGMGDLEAFIPDVPASACAVGIGEAAFPIESGNILVNDALP
jgi:hypothetical protein